MASADRYNIIRLALIGKTGVGKSSLGNTIIGAYEFPESIGGESETLTCNSQVSRLRNGSLVKVVDTPGILDTRGREQYARNEVTKAIGYLSPGPHAFLIVLAPGRTTREEKQVLAELRSLFGDESFLNYTILVMVRKRDLKGHNRRRISIYDYMNNLASEETKELYRLCGKRIVAVENDSDEDERSQYAMEIMDEVAKLGGRYFSHDYFKAMQELKIKEEELRQKNLQLALMEQKLQEIARKKKNRFCVIL